MKKNVYIDNKSGIRTCDLIVALSQLDGHPTLCNPDLSVCQNRNSLILSNTSSKNIALTQESGIVNSQ